MSEHAKKLTWDQTGERYFETGVDHGVLYPISNAGTYNKGVAWNGLRSVNENPSGGDLTSLYADNMKYLVLSGTENFGGTIGAYYYPPEWEVCDGSEQASPGVVITQQGRRTFGLSYRTRIGNDVEGDELGYKLHLIYGAKAKPSGRDYQTVNESPSAIEFSWEFECTPVDVPGKKPTARIIIDSTLVDAAKLAALEEILYGKDPTTPGGTDGVDARLPLPAEIIELFSDTPAAG